MRHGASFDDQGSLEQRDGASEHQQHHQLKAENGASEGRAPADHQHVAVSLGVGIHHDQSVHDDELQEAAELETLAASSASSSSHLADLLPLRESDGRGGAAIGATRQPGRRTQENACRSGAAADAAAAGLGTEFRWADLARHRVLSRVVPMYMTLCAYNMSYAEVMPLYAIALVGDGGLELTSAQIGVIFAINAVMSIVVNYFFSFATDRMRLLTLWRTCSVAYAATVPLVGCSSLLLKWTSNSTNAVMALLVAISAVRVTSTGFMFSLCMLFVANAAPKEFLGRVTGMSHASGSVARSLAPMIAAPLFAWSLSGHDGHVFPFDHNLLFVLCGAAAMGGYYLSTRLSEEDVTVVR
jgi:hypothetical protein